MACRHVYGNVSTIDCPVSPPARFRLQSRSHVDFGSNVVVTLAGSGARHMLIYSRKLSPMLVSLSCPRTLPRNPQSWSSRVRDRSSFLIGRSITKQGAYSYSYIQISNRSLRSSETLAIGQDFCRSRADSNVLLLRLKVRGPAWVGVLD